MAVKSPLRFCSLCRLHFVAKHIGQRLPQVETALFKGRRKEVPEPLKSAAAQGKAEACFLGCVATDWACGKIVRRPAYGLKKRPATPGNIKRPV